MVVLLIGCSQGTNLIPKSILAPDTKKEITDLIKAKDYAKLQDIGAPAVSLILKRIFEIANNRSLSRDVVISAEAGNYIIILGKIADQEAVPALNFLLKSKKYRVFRTYVASTLKQIGDKEAISALWQVFEEEKGYLAEGDRKGPDLGWDLPKNFTYKVLLEVGIALTRLGEEVGEIPMDENTLKYYDSFMR